MKSILAIIAGAGLLAQAPAAVVTFEELPLGNPAADGSTQYGATGTYYWNGSNGAGSFNSSGLTFANSYNPKYGSWSGFAYSETTDTTTAGWGNQFSALAGAGAEGSSTYLVGFDSPTVTFARQDLAECSLWVTNTTYAGLSMRYGDGFAKKFGGASGNDPDWFMMTVTAYDTGVAGSSVSFYLADFRFVDNAQDYILDDWAELSLGALGKADQLRFSFSSSDNGEWGMNTPAYAAFDNFTNFQAVPEPAAPLVAIMGLALAIRRRRP